jgi:ABC-type Fe3+/spermidine/putrescine transport system ATPase subunit
VTAPSLVVEALSAPFGEAPGLAEVSLDVAAGECVALVGASGAGKTTLLRAIAGLGPMSSGRVTLGGRDVTHEPPERRHAIYLHQTPLLFPHLTVAENVAFPLRVRRWAAPEISKRVAEALEAVRLAGFDARRPYTLSGGQRHRVALARAIAARPAALLLDEPLAALDPSLREEVRETLQALQRAYRPAVLLVTHDLDEAGLLATRVGVLLGGRLAQLAPPADLFRRPATIDVASFLGIPNVVPGTVDTAGRFESALGTLAPTDHPLRPGPAAAVFGANALMPAAAGAIEGTVLQLRHRPRETTALIRVGPLVLEARADTGTLPAPGDAVRLALSERSICLLPLP